ncbi:MAG TPA: TonB family protein [Pyrinomonadaceae bacterium]|jgi:TonB family protein
MLTSRLILIFILLCVAVEGVTAQSPQGNDSQQLTEARELNAKTVKLYGEHKYEEALPLALRVVDLVTTAFGKTDSHLILPLINLGDLYLAMLRADDAKASFERALTIAQTSFGRTDMALTRPLDELGHLMRKAGEYQKAADFFSRSLDIKQKLLKPTDVEIARAAYWAAEAYRLNRAFSTAEPLYEQAIKLYDQAGIKDAELVEALRRCLIVLTSENKKDKAALIQSRLAELSAEQGIVEGGIVNGWAVKLAQPSYPLGARGAHASGQVRVEVLIDESGNVISADAIGGHPLLQAASVAAAKESKFTPTLKSGVPVKVRGVIIYNFVIQ